MMRSSLKIVVTFFLFFFYFGCQRDIKNVAKLECLDKIESLILNKNIKDLNFDNSINCFEWDSLKIVNLNSSELSKYFDYKFKVINDDKYKRMSNKGKVEIDSEPWSYIFFFNEGIRQDNVIALNSNDLYTKRLLNKSIKIAKKDAIFIKKPKEYYNTDGSFFHTFYNLVFKDSILNIKYEI